MVETNPPAGPTLLAYPGTLWERSRARTAAAKASGALQSLPTAVETIATGGIEFCVRVLQNLERKERARRQQESNQAAGKPTNPFLPYERELFVQDISETHVCILNKYNVADNHLLLITRDFVAQDEPLTRADCEAACAVLRDRDAFVFYNCGRDAGASQRHKHLQVLPLAGPELPIAPALDRATGTTSPLLPFAHAIAPLALDYAQPVAAAAELLDRYRQVSAALQLDGTPHNVLLAREWLFVVPRSRGECDGINVNSLGFAGLLLVKNRAQLAQLRALTPLGLLQRVATSGEIEPRGRQT